MRKAQADILGLVVIVILFIIIAVVFVRLSTLPKSESIVRENIEVSNLLSALMKLTPCNSIRPLDSLSDVIERCNNGPYCGSPNCKDYIIEQIENVALEAFDKETYSFSVVKSGDLFIEVGQCIGETKFVDKAITPRFVAQLEVCR